MPDSFAPREDELASHRRHRRGLHNRVRVDEVPSLGIRARRPRPTLEESRQALRRLQDMVCAAFPGNVSLADELIAERRAEAERE